MPDKNSKKGSASLGKTTNSRLKAAPTSAATSKRSKVKKGKFQSGDFSSISSRFQHLPLKSAHALVRSARKGLAPQIFYDTAEATQIPEKVLAGILNISPRTISNYADQERLLDPAQSEHLLKLIVLYETGETLFGSLEEFKYWLQKPFWNDEERPVEWLVTPGGVDLLINELQKLAHGYPV